MSERRRFLEAADRPRQGGWTLLGVPLDRTACFRGGTMAGPDAIRWGSDDFWPYCPVSDRELAEIGFFDAGDVPLGSATMQEDLEQIRTAVEGILSTGARPLLLGGEHTLSFPAVQALLVLHPDLCVVHFDAHADLSDEYEGERWHHATVLRRVVDLLGEGRLFQFGPRCVTREEWRWMHAHGAFRPSTRDGVAGVLRDVAGRPVYLTVDLDILDPGTLPGTGAPYPGGLSWAELDGLLRALRGARVVGGDVVELAPGLDPTGASSIVAAKVVMTMLLDL